MTGLATSSHLKRKDFLINAYQHKSPGGQKSLPTLHF